MSNKKTLEQIRDNGSKRHCWPREQISDVYQYGYIAGFDASTAIHQERTKKLAEALSIAADRLLSVSLAIKEHDTNINPQFFIERFDKFSKDARLILQEYNEVNNENFFKPEDFEDGKTVYGFESWPVVYGFNGAVWSRARTHEETHQARLAFIEEIIKEPCRHEPDIHFDGKTDITSFIPKCKHCGVELQATWTEKK